MTRLIPILLLISISVFGQNNNKERDILLATKKEDGVYKTFIEFRTNSPSIKGTLKITNHKIKLLNEQTNKFVNIRESYWGACLNDTVYVFLDDPHTAQSPHIYTLDLLGRYCYFSDYGVYTTMTPGLAWNSSSYKAEYVININNGIIYKIDKKLMREILSKDPNLLNEFEAESNKRQVFKKYIEIINTKRTGDIKPLTE